MLSAKPFNIGKTSGTIYDFAEAGDMLPMHAHDETTNHMTVVARGSFLARGEYWPERELAIGDVVVWQPNDPHEFEAKEPNSRMVNIKV